MFIKFLTPVSHDGVDYAIGATADLSAESAKLLLSGGFAELKGRPGASKSAVEDAVIINDESATA